MKDAVVLIIKNALKLLKDCNAIRKRISGIIISYVSYFDDAHSNLSGPLPAVMMI